MKYTYLSIQTQREAPNNPRTQGFAFLARPGYMNRDRELLPPGQQTIEHLQKLAQKMSASFISLHSLHTIGKAEETYYPLSS